MALNVAGVIASLGSNRDGDIGDVALVYGAVVSYEASLMKIMGCIINDDMSVGSAEAEAVDAGTAKTFNRPGSVFQSDLSTNL